MPYACKFCIALYGLKAIDVPQLPEDEAEVREHVKTAHGYPGRSARDILGCGHERELAADLIERTDSVVRVTLADKSVVQQ
jgi:hypothetical protein